jgi:hypothetical protein
MFLGVEVRRSRLATTAIVTAAGILTAAGCSSGGGIDAGGHPSSPATASATPHASSPAGAVPTGVQLGKILSAAHLPAGWKLAPGADSSSNSGPLNTTTQQGPQPAEYACRFLSSGVQAEYIVSWWQESDATMLLEYPSKATTLPQVTLTVAAYAPGDAAKNMAKAAALMAHCRSFRDPSLDHDRDQTSVKNVPHLGDQNLFLTSSEQTSAGTVTGQLLLARVGNYIVGVATNTGDAGDVRPATVQGFGGWLAQLLEHAKSAG